MAGVGVRMIVGRVAARVVGVWSRDRASISPLLLIAGAIGIVVALKFSRPVADEADPLRAIVGTCLTLFALAAAWLFRAQFAQAHRLRDLLLAAALLTLAAVNACNTASTVLGLSTGRAISGAVLWGDLLAAALFALAASNPRPMLVTGTRRSTTIAAVLCIAAVVLAGVGSLTLADQPVSGGFEPFGDASLGHWLANVLVVGSGALSVYAALVFGYGARCERDRGASLLAAGLLLLGAAQFSRLGAITISPDQIPSSDVLSLLACAVIVCAAQGQEAGARAAIARAAALAERQRVARDLHDGLAQDLAFIAAHSEQIAQGMGPQHPVVLAARRALDVSRSMIAQLSDPASTTAHDALEAVAHELRDRFAIQITVRGQLPTEPEARARHDMVRIAREAIANAARHGGAERVAVSLECRDTALVMRVCDDGSGLELGSGPGVREGFGLRSMRDRAADCGGHVTIRQSGNHGTELEFVLP